MFSKQLVKEELNLQCDSINEQHLWDGCLEKMPLAPGLLLSRCCLFWIATLGRILSLVCNLVLQLSCRAHSVHIVKYCWVSFSLSIDVLSLFFSIVHVTHANMFV